MFAQFRQLFPKYHDIRIGIVVLQPQAVQALLKDTNPLSIGVLCSTLANGGPNTGKLALQGSRTGFKFFFLEFGQLQLITKLRHAGISLLLRSIGVFREELLEPVLSLGQLLLVAFDLFVDEIVGVAAFGPLTVFGFFYKDLPQFLGNAECFHLGSGREANTEITVAPGPDRQTRANVRNPVLKCRRVRGRIRINFRIQSHFLDQAPAHQQFFCSRGTVVNLRGHGAPFHQRRNDVAVVYEDDGLRLILIGPYKACSKHSKTDNHKRKKREALPAPDLANDLLR